MPRITAMGKAIKMRSHRFRKIKYRISTDCVVDGYAEVPGPRKPREIYVNTGLAPKIFLEKAIHEAMHAEDPTIKSEQVIDRRAKSMARWLWRLGYRRQQ